MATYWQTRAIEEEARQHELTKEEMKKIEEIYNETIEYCDPKEELSVDYLAWLSYEYVVNCLLSEEPVADFIV